MNVRASFFFVVFCIIFSSSTIFSQEFSHDPPYDFINSEPINLRVKVKDVADYEVKCFYKFNDSDEYSIIELEKLGTRLFKIDIDPPANSNNLKYYFWVYKNNQFYQTLPKNNPVSIPYSVINTQEELEYFSVLSPSLTKKKLDYRKQMMFVLRNNYPNSISFVEATLNDDERLDVLNKKRLLLNLKSTFPIRQGKNRLKIKAMLSDGAMVEQIFEFKTKKLKEKKMFKRSNIVKLSNNFYNTNKDSYTQEDVDLLYTFNQNLETNSWYIETYGAYDSRESNDTQPYSRYYVNAIDKQFRWKFSGGDFQENLSPLTLNGRIIRGVYTDVDLLKVFSMKSSLSASFLTGISNRKIEVSSPNITIPTYKQTAQGYQVQFSTMQLKSSVQYLHIYDDPTSLSEGSKGVISPIENHVLGWFFQWRPTPLSLIENELVGSAYYNDHEAESVDIESLEISPYLKQIINKYLPIKTSLVGGYTNRLKTQFPVINKKNLLKINYEITQPNFYNELNSFIEPDQRTFSGTLTQKMLNRRLIVNTTIENEKDNIAETSTDTSYTNSYRINTNYRTNKFGNINLNTMLTKKHEQVTTANEDIDNQLNFISLGISGVPLKSGNVDVMGNVSYSLSQYNDYVITDNNSSNTSLNTSFSTSYNDYRAAIGLSQSSSKSNLSGKSRYLSVYTNLSRKINKSFRFSTKIKLTLGKNANESNKMDSQKLSHSWSFVYNKRNLKFFKESSMRLGFEIIAMKDAANPDEETSNFIESYTSFSLTNKF